MSSPCQTQGIYFPVLEPIPALSYRAYCDSLSAAPAAANSLQSCPILCDHIDSNPPGSPIPGILQARILEWVAISSCWWAGFHKLISNDSFRAELVLLALTYSSCALTVSSAVQLLLMKTKCKVWPLPAGWRDPSHHFCVNVRVKLLLVPEQLNGSPTLVGTSGKPSWRDNFTGSRR